MRTPAEAAEPGAAVEHRADPRLHHARARGDEVRPRVLRLDLQPGWAIILIVLSAIAGFGRTRQEKVLATVVTAVAAVAFAGGLARVLILDAWFGSSKAVIW